MPDEKENDKIHQPGLLKRVAGYLNTGMDKLYKSVYYSDPSNKQDLDNITRGINSTIRDIMNSTTDAVGQPNITKLYERLLTSGSSRDGKLDSEFERIFGANEFTAQITGSYLATRWVKTIDMEIDTILRYMPKLAEAINVLTDNVLSADSFSKDYLALSNDLGDTERSNEQFTKNIENLKNKYDLLKLGKNIYTTTSTYGECYVYRVPYTKAIQRLIDRRSQAKILGVKADEAGIVFESSIDGITRVPYSETENHPNFNPSTFNNECGQFNCNITIEEGIISNIVEAEQMARKKQTSVQKESLFNEAMSDVDYRSNIDTILSEDKIDRIDINSGSRAYAADKTLEREPRELRGKYPKHRHFDRTIGDELELPDLDDTSSDGLYDKNSKSGKIKEMNGCIVKKLKRERVIPIILNDVCLGYYYFEFDNTMEMFDERMSSTGLVNTLTGIRSNHRMEAFDSMQHREEMLKTISAELAKRIDVKFIDANQDLKREIYYILKYNDDYNAALGQANNIRVSYIPPEDIQHFYFELDEDTGRGISDLNMSLIPAKLWVAITLCNALGIMTRSNDKRVYYVRQSVDTNISKTLLKTINEIKRANFNIRQIENINSVLNITGRFNDFIIPRSADGQSPIDFEVMEGQHIEIKTELLTILEEAAINPIVPLEIIQARQSPDFMTQLTMTHSKFLRFVYDRQANFQVQLSKFITDLYDLEYGVRDRITLKLPPPLFINVNNTNQLVQNTLDYCNNIVNVVAPDEQDDTMKQKITKQLATYFLGSYIDIDVVNSLIDKAKQSKSMDTVSQDFGDQDMGNNDMNMSGGF